MISPEQRNALSVLHFDPAPTPDDVWRPSPFNVPELHEKAAAEIISGVNRARHDDIAKPIGVVVQGRAGSGKTHLLGALREKIQNDHGGYFVLVHMIGGRSFWASTALSMVESLDKPALGWASQLTRFLRTLAVDLHLNTDVRDAVAGSGGLTRADLDAFVIALRTKHRVVGRECQDTARALVLHNSADFAAQDVGYAHLISEPGDPDGRVAWGLTPAVRTPQQIVQDISWLVALTLAPTVIAIDQIDTLFAQTTTAIFDRHEKLEEQDATVLGQVADGLLMLRETTRRTLTVVSCLPDIWVLLQKCAPGPVIDRFRVELLPDRIPNAQIGQAIVAKRFTAMFADRNFVAPYSTWPIAPHAFEEAWAFTPRELIRRVERHVRHCLEQDEVMPLERLTGNEPETVFQPPPCNVDLAALDKRFDRLVETAVVDSALDQVTEDETMPMLLSAGLAAWIEEQAPTEAAYKHDPPPSRKPALHARLIQVVDESTENEAHWAFRAIATPNAIATISRVRAACTMAGLDAAVPQRRVFLLRNTPWPNGKRTKEILDAYAAAGGVVLPVPEVDLKVFAALAAMREATGFMEWVRERKPATNTSVFRMAFPTPPNESSEIEGAISLGSRTDETGSLSINLESLRRHSVIFAGSGSGKTVLIRRLVEECARKGVSSIVLDPNNDLARLGDAWPEPPSGWENGDVERARDYLDNTDVVIWTPRVQAGRPLSFQPMPEFGPVRDSPDELDQAISSAVEALAPRAGVNGGSKAAQQGKAVLTEALLAYAKTENCGLRGFTDFLAELPDGVSRMAKAAKLAADVAETLKAAMVTDPLFGGKGAAVDPGELLTPPPGKRARISVVSFAGLSSDEQRQSFVNQLQMALFAWIKRNPAGDRPLGGLLVMDEAQTIAPAAGNTPCTASTIALASQARKYGLGLVFATQAPKGLHNQISGNATTQFFGQLNAPAQIDAARELAQAKGGRMPDIGTLTSGQFYAAGEGFSFVKVRTPLCLSYHPKAPLSPEEVITRASLRV